MNHLAPLSALLFMAASVPLAHAQTPSTKADPGSKPVTVYTTALNTDHRLAKTDTLSFAPLAQPLETQVCVFVDPSKTFQTFVGIGGAVTDAAAETFAKLPKDKQAELMKAYYDPKDGIGYTLLRTTIHSSDFSSGSYTYVEDNDKDLSSFSVAHDEQYRLPFIKQAIETAGGKLTTFVAPWSPPAWMKTNGSMLKGGKLLPEYRQTWADYFVKFIQAYEQAGVPIWGLSIQNEPMATQTWESCVFTAEDARDFIKEYLGPTLHKDGLGDKKLIAWDHNRDLVYQQASTILEDPEAAKYVWGIGFHWYETWTTSNMLFDNVALVHEAFPDKPLLLTEACVEKYSPERLKDWALGERYGHSMVNDFNTGAVAWTDWNVLLDEKGGPNHVGNYCFAPVIGDTKTGELIYTNSYYYLGHFSKFIHPGAKRIPAAASRSWLETTAFVNPDGSTVVVVLNTSEREQKYKLWVHGKAADATSLAHSISTLVF